MDKTNTLFASLAELDFLSEGDKDFGKYSLFEDAVIDHCLKNEHEQMVFFDVECIETDGDYASLCRQIIQAMPFESGITEVPSFLDIGKELAGCSAKKSGKSVAAKWRQTNDYVTSEFMDYIIRLCNNKKGKFFELDTGDQNYFAIFVPTDVFKALAEYKNDSLKSRNEFLTSDSPMAKQAHQNVAIFSEREAEKVIRTAQEAFIIESGDFSDVSAYKAGTCQEIALTSGDDLFEASMNLMEHNPRIQHFLNKNKYKYDVIVPDEDCYFISRREPEQMIVFEYPAKQVLSNIVGERQSSPIDSYLLVGKGFDWCIYFEESSLDKSIYPCLLSVGEKTQQLVEQNCLDVKGDQVVEDLYQFLTGTLAKYLAKRGYERAISKMDSFQKSFVNHDAIVEIRIDKEAFDNTANVLLILYIRVADESQQSEQKTYFWVSNAKSQLVWSEDNKENIFTLESHEHFKELEYWMMARLESELIWMDSNYSFDDLVDIYLKGEKYTDAAALSMEKLSDVERTKKILQQAIEENPDRRESYVQYAIDRFGLHL